MRCVLTTFCVLWLVACQGASSPDLAPAAEAADASGLFDLGLTGADEPHPPPPAIDSPLLLRDVSAWARVDRLHSTRMLSVADTDGDGWMDILAGGLTSIVVFRNQGDGSFLQGQTYEIGTMAAFIYSADVTGDGLDDLLAVLYDSTVAILEGKGGGTFVQRRDLVPTLPADAQPSVATFGDFRGVDRLDIYAARMTSVDPSTMRTAAPCDPNDRGGGPTAPMPGSQSWYLQATEAGYVEMSEPAGLTAKGPQRTQSALTVDVDGNGTLDIIAGLEFHDRPLVFLGDGHGHFVESGEALGFTFLASAMGSDAADIDGDGDLDVFISDAYPSGGGDLYVQGPDHRFNNDAGTHGLGATQFMTSWGAVLEDFDNDGSVDLFLANGDPHIPCGVDGAQPNALFLNDGAGRFEEVHAAPGSGLEVMEDSRGAVVADFDRDGDLDVLVANASVPPTLLRNEIGQANHYIDIALRHPKLSPAVGAIVTIVVGGKTQQRWVKGTPSWGGSSSPLVHFGCGKATRVDEVTVRWPHGEVQHAGPFDVDRVETIGFAP